MTKNTRDWLIVVGISLLITIASGSAMGPNFTYIIFFLLFLSGTVGVYYGFFNGNLEVEFIMALLGALLLIAIGTYYHKEIWGKILIVSGVYLWCFAGYDNFISLY